ncbi:MAG: hypothetical protein ACK46X_04080 [Candidatus Sericytochromatia bacterium]
MRHAKTALMFLRLGIGLYLVFTAVTRLMGFETRGSFASLYDLMGAGVPVNQSAFAVGASIFLGLLGLLLLSGRLLVVGGVLVALVGLVSGISEIVASQTLGLAPIDQSTRLTNGVHDVLVLASTGGAIAALDAYIRHRIYRNRQANVTMYREEGIPVGTAAGTTTTTGTTTTRDEPPSSPYF